jgi:hypothetical protein
MITLSVKDTGAVLGNISEDDLQLLVDLLEEENDQDTDYFMSADTIEMLEEDGASTGLIGLLKKAVGDSEGVEIQWIKS